MNQEKCAITAARMIKSVDDHHQKLFIEGLLAGFSEAKRLQKRYPKVPVVPMLYKVEDNLLYLLMEK